MMYSTEQRMQAFCAINAAFFPARFSLASIAILQNSSTTLSYSLNNVFWQSESFWKNVSKIKELYSSQKIQNKIISGQLAYPDPMDETASLKGMGFELRWVPFHVFVAIRVLNSNFSSDVSFAYPGSHKKTNALEKLNLTIAPGSLVVIVGANGSGKSTLVRILSRLFDPTSGQLLIDGRAASEYALADLRRASTLLSQENQVYPLSLAENIGLGCLDYLGDMDKIKEAADKGGAAGFIGKLETGYETKMDDGAKATCRNLLGKPDHPLKKEMDKLEKKINISGGEKQRLVA